MNLSGEFLAFISLSLVAITGGLLLLNLTRVIHMLVALVFSFISIAGIYVMLSAEFVAAVQVLIYSGAVTIIMLFGIMLTKHNDHQEKKINTWRRIALLAGIAGFAAAVYLGIYKLDIPVQQSALHESNTEKIGMALYSKHIIPFEITSVILLVALVGAILLAKNDDKEEGGRS
ncbi:NADH-quinone oxidoreductase subunit J [Peribacillus sp. SCS-155]|uniref:NADH-quinone oxidoreductase subunit J n=1 Tax=Peribacillus sedimenti TaxID=3115297 RepID=UPI0039064AF3